MSVGDGVGMGLGRALQDFGRAMYEDHVWKERRKMLAEEARSELEMQRKNRREDLKYEASLKPPQVAESEEMDAEGKRVRVKRQWEPNFEQGGGQYRELSRIPVMTEREQRNQEAKEYGLEGDAMTSYALTGRLPTDFGRHRLPGTVADRKPAPSWRTVKHPKIDGAWAFFDPNSGRYAQDDKGILEASPPYRERDGRKAKDEPGDDPLAIAPKPSRADADKEARDKFSEENKRKFPGAPAIGTVEDGMEYMGGDPANENNWRPAR